MHKYLVLLFLFVFFHISLQAERKTYVLTDAPIDVVIVSHPKDKDTLEYCIEGIRENGKNIRRIIVVSSIKLTEHAEWFDEKYFPFTIKQIAYAIGKDDKKKSEEFFNRTSRGPGWYFQQLLKLYSSFIIPGISPNVLVIDADTVFLNPTHFLNESFGGLFCVSYRPGKLAYFNHANRLLPGYERIYPEFYSVCHHMLFQRPILKEFFKTVEQYHKKPFWKAFCLAVDLKGKKGASEYELYYNYALRNTDQVEIRELIYGLIAHILKIVFFIKKMDIILFLFIPI
jgi:hypothetical protein